MKILLVAPNWIRDAVMSLSLVQALAHKYTDSVSGQTPDIHVLAPHATAPVYQFTPHVRAVQVEPFAHGKLQWGLRKRVGKALSGHGFDLAVVLPNSLKSALVPWFAGIAQRVGYDGELRRLVLTQALPKPSKTNKPPMVEWYGQLGGFGGDQLQNPVLRVEPGLQRQAFHEFSVSAGFLGLAPGAEFGPAKRWPAAHFAAVADHYLLCNPGQQVVLFGGPKDREFSDQIVSLLPQAVRSRALVLAGQTTLAQAIALMSGAGQLVTNDSGLMHVAAALGVQVHAVFGSSSPKHTPPLHPQAKVYYLSLPCSPCFQRECPLGHTDCLNKLKPEMVISQLVRAPGAV
ncbi:lipopolysaccharide heptosyltransferase II [Limnobacter sp.]|uniref:lipopolysaccharide heptosyltransferase II n=1 Tax=Limnobacter sp. TaxID=2003368 RepID=UPI003519425F